MLHLQATLRLSLRPLSAQHPLHLFQQGLALPRLFQLVLPLLSHLLDLIRFPKPPIPLQNSLSLRLRYRLNLLPLPSTLLQELLQHR